MLPVRLSYCPRDGNFYRVVQIASFDGKVRDPPRNGIWISVGNGGEDEAVVSNDEAASAAVTEVETIEVSSSESELEGVLGNSAEQTPLVAVEVGG